MSVRLYDSKPAEDNVHKYIFLVEKYSNLGPELYSKPFHFAGHRWKLQTSVKEKHFGVFLRWLGGGELTKGVKCKLNFILGVLNTRDGSKSIHHGSLKVTDEFSKAGCGIGWSKLVSLQDLTNEPGFINDDRLTVELQCRMVETTFENKIGCVLKPGEDKFIKTPPFSLCNNRWSIIIFPVGLPNKKGVPPQNDHVAVYLHCEDGGLLRYKVMFSFYMRSKYAKQREISYHFYNEDCASSNTFGIEQFLPAKEMKKIAKKDKVKIRVVIKSIEPYFYLGIHPNTLKGGDEREGYTRGDLQDQCGNQLGLSLEAPEGGAIMFKLQYDPNGENEALAVLPYFKKIYWRAVVNVFENYDDTVVVSSSEEAGKSSFCYSEDECSITSNLELSQVEEKGSCFLDEDGLLSVHLFIEDANLVYDPLLDPLTKRSVSKLREEREQRLKNLEKQCENIIENTLAEKDVIITEQEELLYERESIISKQDSHISDLTSEMQENDKYLNDIVDGNNNGEKTNTDIKRSLRQLIRNTRPSKDDLKVQNTVAKKLNKFLKKKLPFGVTRVSGVGAYGEETSLRGIRECSLAVVIKDLPRTEHDSWLPTIVATIKTLLSQRDKTDTSLPPCSNFVTTKSEVKFKFADVVVTLMPINDWESHGGYHDLYQLSMKQPSDVQIYYINNVCELQTAFIAKQEPKCKDLIRVVKKWSDDTMWSDGCKPTYYIISLLVIQAFENLEAGRQEKGVDLDVLLEMLEILNDPNLDLSWDTDNYIVAQYPRKFFPNQFSSPVIQDPAIPTHNVAETGVKDWGEFRSKFKEWVTSLSP